MMEGPWCRFRREARARERHRHCSGGQSEKRLTQTGRLEKQTSGGKRSLESRVLMSLLALTAQRKAPNREQRSNDKADPRNSHGHGMGSNLHGPPFKNPPAVQDRY